MTYCFFYASGTQTYKRHPQMLFVILRLIVFVYASATFPHADCRSAQEEYMYVYLCFVA